MNELLLLATTAASNPAALKIWAYLAFIGLVVVFLALDLGVFHREAHEVKMKEAVTWSAIWLTWTRPSCFTPIRRKLLHHELSARATAKLLPAPRQCKGHTGSDEAGGAVGLPGRCSGGDQSHIYIYFYAWRRKRLCKRGD